MDFLKLENVGFSYDRKEILKNVNFEIKKGDYLCIVGNNGAGKTTLLKILIGLLTPTCGEIIRSDEVKLKKYGYLPQKRFIQSDFPASVIEVVSSGCISTRKGLATLALFSFLRERRHARHSLKIAGIEDLEKRSFMELSGGQQQKVLLARALCASDTMLFLDEPITGLDPSARGNFYDVLDRLNKEEEVTIITVSHDITEGIDRANKVLWLREDEHFLGSPDEYRKEVSRK